MAKTGRHQKKKLGQVFLSQPNTIRKIVDDLELTGEEHALEIGGGDGRVSAEIAPRVSSLMINEIDDRFVEVLRERFASQPHISIIPGSILSEQTLERIQQLSNGHPLVVYGSIPYYITTPIIKWVIANHSFVSKASLLMQKEVAERAVATPGNKEYGFLSVFVQLQAFAFPGALVRRSCFKPSPKVDSRVLNIIPRTEEIAMFDKKFWGFISSLFNRRRKQLKNLVKGYLNDGLDSGLEAKLEKVGILLTDRPESYAPHQLKMLYEVIQAH